MISVGAFDAKTHFSQLLTKVAKGKTVMITKHGKVVAKLVPADIKITEQDPAIEAVKAIRVLRKGVFLGKDLSIKQLIQEGRKW